MAIPREVKVGAFVFAGLVIAGVVVFMIGDERRLFESKTDYYSVFEDVQGLKRGAPVRMGGIDIGEVGSVAYPEDSKDVKITVMMSIVESETVRIREDSVASIQNRGLLGDKMLVVTVGDPEKPQIPPGQVVPSEESRDLTQMMDKISSITHKAETVMGNLEKTTGTFASKEFRQDVQTTVHSLGNILKEVDEGDGFASRLIRDPEEADKISRTLSNLERTTARLDRTVAGVHQAVDRVNTGPGFAHEIIYGNESTKTVESFGRAADEVATTLKGIREGDGLARDILYGGDGEQQQMMSDLNEVARDLKYIVRDVRQGKGTIGALLVDPSVYEDLKLLLGNVERNKALRALVRYSIQRDEKVPSVEIRDPSGPGEGSAEGKLSSPQRD